MGERMTTEDRRATLRDEVREVRASILDMLMQVDHLRLQVIPQVLADYQLKIGCWEKALCEAMLAGRRAKRRLALVQARVNRGEPVDDERIEAQLDEELAVWQAEVEKARQTYERAMTRLATYTALAPKDAAALKSAYRTLVRRLHPDVCRSASEETATLFKIARAAYEAGDLKMLQSLEVATRHLEAADDLADVTDAAALEQELELARIEEGVVRSQLEEVEACEELRLRDRLADAVWVSARVTELREAVERWEASTEACQTRERELREACNGC